jgi:hypothetical protein
VRLKVRGREPEPHRGAPVVVKVPPVVVRVAEPEGPGRPELEEEAERVAAEPQRIRLRQGPKS